MSNIDPCSVPSGADEELFEDNPEEYIRRDIEGSDIDTRRRAACDLVRALTRHFEGPVIQNFTQYVNAMLQVRHSGSQSSFCVIYNQYDLAVVMLFLKF